MIDDWFVSQDGKRCFIRSGDQLAVVPLDEDVLAALRRGDFDMPASGESEQ